MVTQYNTARYVAAPLTDIAINAYYAGGCGGNCLKPSVVAANNEANVAIQEHLSQSVPQVETVHEAVATTATISDTGRQGILLGLLLIGGLIVLVS